MINLTSNTEQLIARIQWLKMGLPLALAIVVIIYQLGVAQAVEQSFGHLVHYSVEIAFYSLTGPIATWLMLGWVERNLREKARFERVALQLNQERAEIVAEERERIARDLHDDVAQTLYYVALKADMAVKLVAEQPEKLRESLKEIGEGARRVIKDVRLTIFSLQPLVWVDEAFLTGLEKFILAFAEQTGWQLELNLPDQGTQVPFPLQSTIYRLINESFVNVAKHAHAQHVELNLRLLEREGMLELGIIDDGHGFETTNSVSAGLGLPQLRSRVAAMNGHFEIESEPGQGTSVHIRLPLLED